MGNILSNGKTLKTRSYRNMDDLNDPLLDPKIINEQLERNSVIVRDRFDRVQTQVDRMSVEVKSCRDDVQKLTTNYGKEIYNLGENCSNLQQDITILMKNQEVIKDLLIKILQNGENGAPVDPSMYSSVNNLNSVCHKNT
jgi:hypothetical protein